jgi:two-component system LytT family response regulator
MIIRETTQVPTSENHAASQKISAIIVDNESLSRERLSSLLESESDFQVLETCSRGEEAVTAAHRLDPDVVFLDIQLPDMDGFRLLKQLQHGDHNKPIAILLAAHDQFAVRAFDSDALDYLLKPITPERFQSTLQRTREEIDRRRSQYTGRTQPPGSSPEDYVQRLVFRNKGRIVFLKIAEVRCITSEGNYLRVSTGKESYLLRETMAAIEAKLDPAMFLRIHRSTIVNLQHVKEVKPSGSQGESLVEMQDGTRHILSRTYRARISELLTH